MKIPKTVKIGAHTYSVLFHNEEAICEDSADIGTTDHIDATITISNSVNKTQKGATLLHEAMHVMNSTIDHALLSSLSEQIYQFLFDNDLLKD